MNKPEDSGYQLKPYLFCDLSYAIPTNSSPKFRMHIAAAIQAYIDKNFTFENMKIVMDKMCIESFSDQVALGRVDFIQDSVVKVVQSVQQELKMVATLTDKVEHMTFLFAYTRLTSSFMSAVTLLKQGFFIEVSAVYRVIYEQICWAYYIFDKDMELIKKTKPASTVGFIKEIHGDYAKLYGMYSEETHINFEVTKNYLKIGENGIGVRMRSGASCEEKTFDLLLLSKMYIEILYTCIDKKLNAPDVDKIEIKQMLVGRLEFIKILLSQYTNEKSSVKMCYSDRI
ncbi:hypothetical protein JJB07_09655 [Tumebacillus sp. ITR2]|uniref:Uncharacterized protein n=1 Tax=Tumebacillus amylolyticus TaxID=2801339 RepID=A0ABS1J9H3_9BACL|nr:hypothetical protein [Tumebacillus amylolyticus]MBL0386918.1 hypothetical protein [Tumebacillus amylolyticus]